MAGGLAALLDDVAMIAKMASSASTKALGVVVDDAAVTPRYVHGFSPARELPMIWRIAQGSLRNKAIILVAIVALSQFVPWILTPLLMLGGLYLSYEGAEKVWEAVSGRHKEHQQTAEPVVERGPDYEDQMVKGAITTDFILSAEIMVISLNAIGEASLVQRGITLVVVALMITALVYGVVALLVKMDDAGLKLMESDNVGVQKLGRLLVTGMPIIMSVLSVVGIAAMLWVGGHILVSGSSTLGWHGPADVIHALAGPAAHVAGVGGFLSWLIDTLCSALVGVVIGGILVAIMYVMPFDRHNPKIDKLETGIK